MGHERNFLLTESTLHIINDKLEKRFAKAFLQISHLSVKCQVPINGKVIDFLVINDKKVTRESLLRLLSVENLKLGKGREKLGKETL